MHRAAPCQRLNYTHAPPHVPLTQLRFTTPQSALAAGVDTLRRAALRNYGRQ